MKASLFNEMRKWSVRKSETTDLEYGLVTRSPKWARSHPNKNYSQTVADNRLKFRDNAVWWMRKEASKALVAEREGGATLATDHYEIFLPKTQLKKMEEGVDSLKGPFKRMQWFLNLMSEDEQVEMFSELDPDNATEGLNLKSDSYFLPTNDQEKRGGFYMKAIHPDTVANVDK